IEFDETEDALLLRVALRIGGIGIEATISNPNVTTSELVEPDAVVTSKKAKLRAAPLAANKALDIFWDKRIREAGKIIKPSPLFPRSKRRSGKSQFNWTPTTDLASRWPASFFIWAAVVVGMLSVIAAFSYAAAYTPGPVATAHTKTALDATPSVAVKANG